MSNGRWSTTAGGLVALAMGTTLLLGGTPPSAAAATVAAPSATTTLATRAGPSGPTTLAGTGTPGFVGDGGPAVHARLDAPGAIVEDGSGDLYIADSGNCRVREVPARSGFSFGRRVQGGHIVTLAGGHCGTDADPPPTALALDPAGDLFIASGPGERVEELPAHGNTSLGEQMTTGRLAAVAGTGAAGDSGDGGGADHSELDDPSGLAVDPSGDLLIADTANCRLRLVAASTGSRFGVAMLKGEIDTVAGTGVCGSNGDGGPALEAELWDPGALAANGDGDILVADQGNRTVRLLTEHAGTYYGVALAAHSLGTVAGDGSYGPYLIDGLPATGGVGEVNFPSALAVDAGGDLYIADGAMHAIRLVPATATTLLGKMVQAGSLSTVAGAESTGALHAVTTWIQTRMADPSGLAVSPHGNLAYSDSDGDVVREVTGVG
jgi:hypothetical protein